MITTTWTKAPADLLGLGSSDVRRCTGYDARTGIAVSPAPRVAPVQGTGVPAGGIAVRLRPDFGQAGTQAQFEIQQLDPRAQLHRRHHPRDPFLEETAELTLDRSSTRPRNPNPGIRGLSLCPRHPATDHRSAASAGHRRDIADENEEERQCSRRSTARRPTADPGSPGPRASHRGDRTPPWLRPRSGVPCRAGSRTRNCGSPRRPAQLELAKSLCADCPVRDACLAGALDRAEPWGVWGGEIFERGSVIARKRPRGRPRKVVAA